MIEFGHADYDAVSNPHLLGNHRARGQEQFRGRTVRILLQEMMLDGTDRIESELGRELHLLQTAVVNDFFRVTSPGTRNRNFVENAEFHGYTSTRMALTYNRSFSAIRRRTKVPTWTVGRQ